jgi:hypothetical protein
MSALPPKADIQAITEIIQVNFRFVPKADVVLLKNCGLSPINSPRYTTRMMNLEYL